MESLHIDAPLYRAAKPAYTRVSPGDGRQSPGNLMTIHRRRFLHLAGFAAVLPAVTPSARAQTWRARPLRLVVGFPPGGPNDILARLVADWLPARLGQPVVVENIASTDAATAAVARAPADGHTLLLIGPANAIGVTLSKNPGFDFRRDFMPVAG